MVRGMAGDPCPSGEIFHGGLALLGRREERKHVKEKMGQNP